MPLVLILGCMFSGKTTELLRRVDKLTAIGKKVLLVHHSIDTRVQQNYVKTHGGIQKVGKEYSSLEEIPYHEYDAVAIDEGQFFQDITTIIPHLDSTLIIVSALNGTFDRKNFGKIHELLPHVDDLIFKTAYCAKCSTINTAMFSKRLTKNKNVLDVGASDKYAAVCRSCYQKD